MNQDALIIFCQAPADMPYVLDLYDINKEKKKISIFVINVEGMYKFLISLNLKLNQLVFIPSYFISLNKMSLLIKERRRINNLWKKYFIEIKHAEVFFFSKFEDWLTSAFIHKLSKNRMVAINYLNHYDNSSSLYIKSNYISFKHKIYLLILELLTDIRFKVEIKEKTPEFPIENYNIKIFNVEKKLEILSKYKAKLDFINIKNPYLLIFVSPCESKIFNPIFFDAQLINVIELFKEKKYSVIVKGHPRLGIPKSIKELADYIIPSYIPGEFIDPAIFNLCLGLETVTICHFSKNTNLPTYSIINLFPYSNKKTYDININYLKQQSNDKMSFCNSIEELNEIASKI